MSDIVSLFDSAPRKCWICDLENLETPLLIELLGAVVAVNEEQLTIDDGTGCADILLDGHPIKGEVGDLIDCIARYCDDFLIRADVIVWDVSPECENLFQWQILEPPGPFGFPTLEFTNVDLLRYIKCAGDDATLENLSIVLDRPMDELSSRMEELQEDGVIYLNRNGVYTLL